MSRGFKVVFVASIIPLAVIIGLWGCGKSPGVIDPPSGEKPKTTKPAVAQKSAYDDESNTAWVCAFITKDGEPFYRPDYYVVFFKAVSGRKITRGGPFGILEEPGKVIVKIGGGKEIINGQYRARLIYLENNGKETVVAEWGSIPINRKNALVLELPIGEMARTLSEPWGNPVEIIYPNSRTVLNKRNGWQEAIITLPKETWGNNAGIDYYVLDGDGNHLDEGGWVVYAPPYPDVFIVRFGGIGYTNAKTARLKLVVKPYYNRDRHVVISQIFAIKKP